MENSKALIKTIGAPNIKAALGVTDGSIRKARREGIPALWFAVMDQMCADMGIDCPKSAFNFKNPVQPGIAASSSLNSPGASVSGAFSGDVG